MLKKIICTTLSFAFLSATVFADAGPASVNGLLREVILGEDNSKPLDTYNDGPAIKVLTGLTSSEILSQVQAFVLGTISFEDVQITKENHAQFIAAAKIVDLTIPAENQACSTYQVRYDALKKSDGINGTPYFDTMINAFAMPPVDVEDPLMLNELDNTHPNFAKMDPQDLLAYRVIMNDFAQNRAKMHPEFIERVKKVASVFARNIENLQEILSPPKVVLYSGGSGVGKSTEMKKRLPDLDLETSIASTDNFITALVKEFNDEFSRAQLFYLGVSLRKEFDMTLKEKYKTPSYIQETWMIKEADILTFFNIDMPIEVNDFDGDLRLVSIRTILRSRLPGGRPTFPWDQMTRGFRDTRKCRPVIWSSIQDKDSYQMFYSYNDGSVKSYSLKEAQELPQLEFNELIDEEIASVTHSLITKEDVARFGDLLAEFEGMTVSEAFEYAKFPVQK